MLIVFAIMNLGLRRAVCLHQLFGEMLQLLMKFYQNV
jgi:hypothetical protein